jgi:opacity protein-like surface antigen
MKKILLTLFFFSFVMLSYSQRFHGGVMGGFVVSQLDGDHLGGYNKPGVRAGGWVNTAISEITTLQLELEYNQKGSKISQNRIATERYYHSRLNYLQVTLPAKFLLIDKWKAEAGIAGGYLIKAMEDDGNGFLEAEPAFDQFELSLIVGLNYNLTENIIGNVRFNYSALAVREHPGGQTYLLNRGQYNNLLAFSVYYKID